jgi:hypothetical protein
MEDEAVNITPKFCGHCGAAIVAGDKFCGECGSAYGNEKETAEKQAQPPPSRNGISAAVIQKPVKRRKLVWIALLIILAAAIGIGYWISKEYFPSGVDMHVKGMMHFHGQAGYPKDRAKAAEWFRRAADKGDSSSAEMLGRMYHEGLGVSMDDSQAFYWWSRAYSLSGSPSTQAKVGIMYMKGQGVAKDLDKGRDICRQAAEGGSSDAAFALGQSYANTMSFDEWQEGCEWYKKAAKSGHKEAQEKLRKLNMTW